jgi:ribosomal protein S12 methylthiotransferase accessory factor
LGELNQLVFANDETTACDRVPDHLCDAASEPCMPLGESGMPYHKEDSSFLEYCVKLLRQRGLEMLVLDQSEPQVQSRVARVVVPGLRSTSARFAPGRLFEVPVALGWRKEPGTQAELESAPAFPGRQIDGPSAPN